MTIKKLLRHIYQQRDSLQREVDKATRQKGYMEEEKICALLGYYGAYSELSLWIKKQLDKEEI